jgi:Uma2 family endonuclease
MGSTGTSGGGGAGGWLRIVVALATRPATRPTAAIPNPARPSCSACRMETIVGRGDLLFEGNVSTEVLVAAFGAACDPVGMDPARKPYFTEAMYLAMERVAENKHELYRGEIWAMAGGSPRHNRLSVRCSALLDQATSATSGRECAPLSSDQRVHVPATGAYCYPDVTVVCGEPTYHSADPDTITNPRLVVEVLSRTTKSHDLGTKFDEYTSIESFTEYVLIWQDRVHVEVRRREGPNRWVVETYEAGAKIELASIGATLDVDALYDGAFRFRGDDEG